MRERHDDLEDDLVEDPEDDDDYVEDDHDPLAGQWCPYCGEERDEHGLCSCDDGDDDDEDLEEEDDD